MHDDILNKGHQVYGVSPQSVDSHQRFKERFDLPFELLSDPNRALIKAFGVAGPFGLGVRRATFLISSDGVIEACHVADFDVASHTRFIKQQINA